MIPLPPTSHGSKQCARCGVDCAAIARVKDERGRYFCRVCYDRAIALMAARIVQSAPGERPPEPIAPIQGTSGVVEVLPPVEWAEGRDGARPLGDEFYELVTPERVHVVATKDCVSCGYEIPEQESVCSHCGFNSILNREADDAQPMVTAATKNGLACCGACGYSLSGLATLVCPECGSPNRISSRRDWDREDSAHVARRELIRPGVYLAIGLAGFAIRAVVAHDAWVLVALLVRCALDIIAAFGTLQLCSLLWLGFNQKYWLVAWKLAGIMALVVLVMAVFGSVGVVSLVVAGTLFIYLVHHELDMELSDAWLVGVATLVAKIAVGVTANAIARAMNWV